MGWQVFVRDAALRAVDEAASRLADAEGSADALVHRMARAWRGLSDAEKEEIVEIVVAVAGAVSLAVGAFRESGKGKKKKARKSAAKVGTTVLKKLAATTVDSDSAKKAKKATKKAAEKAKKKAKKK
jgi:hypothetical protein